MNLRNLSILLLLVQIVIPFYTMAQVETKPLKKDQLGLTYSALGKNDVMSFEKLNGGPGYLGDYFNTFGLTFIHPLNSTFDLETGVEYSRQVITISPGVMPDSNILPYHKDFALVTIPIMMKVDFLKYLFLNGGIFLDMDASASMPIKSQTGFGAALGTGINYHFRNRISLFINPYIRMHSLVHFSPEKNQQHIVEQGFRFGIVCDI